MGTLTRDQLREIYRHMWLTRSLEERLERLHKQGHVTGGLYRSLGQEATAVGSAYALEEGDWLAPSIRDVGALFVRGLPPEEMLRQYTSRGTALTGGRDTTTHFTLPDRGLLGPVSPLGTQLCVLNGIALALRTRGRDRVCLTYLGEGASRTGAAHEGMNLAAVRRLPVVVVLEHNRWSFSTPSHREAAVQEWSDVAGAYGIPVHHVDGNDVLEVYDAAIQAVERARRGEGASLLAAETYRMLGHAQHDPQSYVDEEELERWRERDPIDRFGSYLREYGFETGRSLEELRAEVDDELEAAVDRVLAEPDPEPEQARHGVWSDHRPGGDEVGRSAPIPWTRREVVGYEDLPAGVSGWTPGTEKG